MSGLLTPPEALMTIAAWEQLRLKPYTCASGKRTIGWGHVILPGEDLEREIARAEAVRLFVRDVATREDDVLEFLDRANLYVETDARLSGMIVGDEEGRLPRNVLTTAQFGALMSFAFNVGMTKFLTAGPGGTLSGVARAVKERRFDDVPAEIRRWVHGTNPATGKKEKLAGLVSRREDEVALWEGRL
jgi:lysozyme